MLSQIAIPLPIIPSQLKYEKKPQDKGLDQLIRDVQRNPIQFNEKLFLKKISQIM